MFPVLPLWAMRVTGGWSEAREGGRQSFGAIKKTAKPGGKVTFNLPESAFCVTCEVSHEMAFGERRRLRAIGALQ
jgi:hypothetical protein